jgi:hypothetical protein
VTHISRGYIEDIVDKLASSSIIKNSVNVIVSSNSEDIVYNEELRSLCEKKCFSFIIQNPSSASKHFDTIYKSCATDLCMILHDDDKIYIRDFNRYILKVLKNPGFGSYSCNDKIIIGKKTKINTVSESETEVLDNLITSLAYIFNRHLVCFPSIVYNRAILDIDFRNERFGKHTDALIVTQLIKRRHLFIGLPALGYRIHNQQDSAKKEYIKYFLKLYLLFVMILSLGRAKFQNLFFLMRRIRYHYHD